MISKDLEQKVIALKALEKIRLVELILESLDNPDNKTLNKWIEESEKRYDAYKAGKIKAHLMKEL